MICISRSICACFLVATVGSFVFSQEKIPQPLPKPNELTTPAKPVDPLKPAEKSSPDKKPNDKKEDVAKLLIPKNLPKLSLGECITIAEANRREIKMAEASFSQTVKGLDSLNNLPNFANRLKPELCYRKQQACHGITAAQANLDKVRTEVIYDVCWTYYTYVYAKQQEEVATEILAQLKIYQDIINKYLKEPDPAIKITQINGHQINLAVDEVKMELTRAQFGQPKALAALRQAMGLDSSFHDFEPKDAGLPIMGGTVTQDQVVSLTMSRRHDLVQAAAAADAFRLEVYAQDKNRFGLQVPTLASASDIHSYHIPAPVRTGDYRPGATPPEMPGMLAGKQKDRVSRAMDLSRRQDLQFEQVQEVIRLEAVQAYITWSESNERMQIAQHSFKEARLLSTATKNNVGNLTQTDQILNYVAAGRIQSRYVESVYEHVKSNINLERVTAGAIRAGFPGR